jgi:hypothetical protein
MPPNACRADRSPISTRLDPSEVQQVADHHPERLLVKSTKTLLKQRAIELSKLRDCFSYLIHSFIHCSSDCGPI